MKPKPDPDGDLDLIAKILDEDSPAEAGDRPEPAPPTKKPQRGRNQLPDPKPIEAEPKKQPATTAKKKFVAKKKALPTKPQASKQKAPSAGSEAGTKIPLPPQKPRPDSATTAAGKAGKPDVAKSRPGWIWPLFGLTWIAIAAGTYFAWTDEHGRPSTARGLEERLAELEASDSTLADQVAELEGARELARWGNEAIAEGHRSALYKLDEYVKDPEIQSLLEVANAEIIRVEAYYLTTRRFRGLPPNLPMPFFPESDPVDALANILLDGAHEWPIRANAAKLLGRQERDPQAADALAEAAHTDSSLYVVQECLLAFTRVTGFQPTGVFDSAAVQKWWQQNRAAFE